MRKDQMILRFDFKKIGYGVYLVTYTTQRGDYWVARIEDMTLIDATKNTEEPRVKDIKALKEAVKNRGTHYHKDGSHFEL